MSWSGPLVTQTLLVLLLTLARLTTPFLRSDRYRFPRNYVSPVVPRDEGELQLDDPRDVDWGGDGGNEVFGRRPPGRRVGGGGERGGGAEAIEWGLEEDGMSEGLAKSRPHHHTHTSPRKEGVDLYGSRAKWARERDSGGSRGGNYRRPYTTHTHAVAQPAEASRQAMLMMASSSPRVGVRSSLGGRGADSCQVDPVKISILPPPSYARHCRPATEYSYGCRGGCSSYARLDVRNTTSLLHSCSCCQPSGYGFRVVKLPCQGFAFRTSVKFALGCHCRPCIASVDAVDIQTLRDFLRHSSFATLG